MLPDYIVDQLERETNQTKVVIEALENYFELQLSSDKWIDERLQAIDMEKASLQKTKEDRKKATENEVKVNEQLQQDFDRFCKALNCDEIYNTKRFNDANKTKIRDYKHYDELKRKYQKNELTIEDYKNVRI